jgi:hypothetical protein
LRPPLLVCNGGACMDANIMFLRTVGTELLKWSVSFEHRSGWNRCLLHRTTGGIFLCKDNDAVLNYLRKQIKSLRISF